MSDNPNPGSLILPDFLIDEPGARPHAGWGVRVVEDRIDAVGSHEELRSQFPADDVWVAPGQVLSPGFVDAHTHMTALLTHGAPPDISVTDLLDMDALTAAVESALFQSLRGGVTCLAECLSAPRLLPGVLPAVASITQRWGLRSVLAYLVDEGEGYEIGQAGLAENANLLGMQQVGTLPALGQGAVAVDQEHSNDQLRQQAEALAWDADARCLLHSRAMIQTLVWVGGQGRIYTPLTELRAQPTTMTWLIWSEGDQAVGLGSDGALFDFFRVMRAARRQSRLDRNAHPLPASVIWRLATLGGAIVLGLEQVGRLAPGWQADLQLIDLSFPAPVSEDNLYDQLLRYGSAQHVQSVLVAGHVLVLSGVVLAVDALAVRERVITAAQRLWATATGRTAKDREEQP